MPQRGSGSVMTPPADCDAPASDEIEVSVFGPGVGESLVVHMGGGEWIVVDSCRDRERQRAAALVYLESLGIDPAEAVRAIVASHWDTDHICTLGEIVEACPEASFWCTAAVGSQEFDAILELAVREDEPLGKRLLELAGILAALRDREEDASQVPRLASESSLLLELPAADGLPRRAVHALAPSHRSVMISAENVRYVLGGGGEMRRRVQKMSRNDASVVLLLDLGGECVLLGGDLEYSKDPHRGWQPAVNRARELGLRSSLVKIPHHGSRNAHDDTMWADALDPRPAAVLTPFFSGLQPLPRNSDRERIRRYTPNAFLTTEKATSTPSTTLLPLVIPPSGELRSIEGDGGHVRWRQRLGSSKGWTVALDNGAQGA